MWQPLFAGLRKLCMHRCRFTDQFVQMLACCVELEQFDWNTSTIDIEWSLRLPLPKLKIFRVNEVVGITTDALTTFLQMNPQLREFGVTKCIGVENRIFANIRESVPLIGNISFTETLPIKLVAPLKDLRLLDALKTLQIDCANDAKVSRLFGQLIAKEMRLEHLDVARCIGSDLISKRLAGMNTLNSLGLFSVSGMNVINLVNIVKNLTNLTHLNFVECMGLNAKGLIEIVGVASKLRQLQFHSIWQGVVIDNNETFRQLQAVLRKRDDKIPLKILAVDMGLVNDCNNKLRNPLSSDDNSLTICWIRSYDLCVRYQTDDFFLFNSFYDYHIRMKASKKPQLI